MEFFSILFTKSVGSSSESIKIQTVTESISSFNIETEVTYSDD